MSAGEKLPSRRRRLSSPDASSPSRQVKADVTEAEDKSGMFCQFVLFYDPFFFLLIETFCLYYFTAFAVSHVVRHFSGS